jgi:hypothetical protein
MSLMSRKSDTHNHLTRKLGQKHVGLHTVTTGNSSVSTLKRPSPFGQLQFDPGAHDPAPAYKPILSL